MNEVKNRFPEYGSDYSFSAFEEKVLAFWKKNKIFEKTLDRPESPTLYFYDGPPFATGLPHYGHIIGGTIKDIVPRYWTMRGYYVPRRFGWDTHGLPVEFELEKTLGLSGSLDIQKYGVAKFNEACRGIVLRYTQDWRQVVERMGRWVDMDHAYKTMDPDFMESVWWVFKELWKKGLIYEGKKVVPYSWRLTAPLSNFEASLNYKDVQDPAITVLFPLLTLPGLDEHEKTWLHTTALAIWTTTPWTLPSNLAVAVQTDPEKVSYGRYKLPTSLGAVTHVIVANERAESMGLTEKTFTLTGGQLLNATYVPLFTSYVDEERKADRAFRVVSGDSFVTSTDGTGLVHMAPSFGEDDYFTCQREKIRPVDPTDMEAKFLKVVAKDERLQSIVGLQVKDADKLIIKVIKDAGRLLKQDVIQHSYPFCDRSDTPLIYKAISSWFVKVDAIKDKMVQNNQEIHWVPGHIKDGRFGKWLENARDWCISRNRFWGTPIPVWRCKDCNYIDVIGSRAELDKLAGRHVEDLHMHFVDEIVSECPKCKSTGAFKRTSEVLDCWFESGSMPYAQEHYPFENKACFEKSFPADFIAEGLDQTRGWFYTLTVLSTALFNKPAFTNCIVNGIVVAEDGRKMSKRLKNYPDPMEVFGKYGADALRLYLMQSPAIHGEELRFSEKSLVELMRAVMIPLWNAYGFFASYANIDSWSSARLQDAPQKNKRPFLDQWILARARETEASIHSAMEKYELALVSTFLIDFIDDLTNWYIRLNRERFWSGVSSESQSDKDSAYATLWEALEELSKMLAPFLPFLAEVLGKALEGVSVDALASVTTSVHEDLFRDPTELALSDEDHLLVSRVRVAKNVILLGRSLRGEAKIGLRQPLQKLRVAGLGAEQSQHLLPLTDLVKKEVNVKDLELVTKASDLVEESCKPNHRVLGKKVGGAMKDIQKELASWGSAEITKFEKQKTATVLGFELQPEDVQIVRKAKPGRLAQAGYGLVAELDTAMNPDLVFEGLQREIINRIQQMRKEKKFHLADRIRVYWDADASSLIGKALLTESQNLGLIAQETLATSLVAQKLDGAVAQEDFGELGKLSFTIEKA